MAMHLQIFNNTYFVCAGAGDVDASRKSAIKRRGAANIER
jgi:hypothetical protein